MHSRSTFRYSPLSKKSIVDNANINNKFIVNKVLPNSESKSKDKQKHSHNNVIIFALFINSLPVKVIPNVLTIM